MGRKPTIIRASEGDPLFELFRKLNSAPPVPSEKVLPRLPGHVPHSTPDIQVGRKVRSYDFPDTSRVDYMDGTVLGFCMFQGGSWRYAVRIERVVRDGREISLSARDSDGIFYPPVNGQHDALMGVKTHGVEVIP